MQKASPTRTGNMEKQFELIPVLMVKLSLTRHTKPYPTQRWHSLSGNHQIWVSDDEGQEVNLIQFLMLDSLGVTETKTLFQIL